MFDREERRETYLGQSDRGLPFVHDAELEGQGVADDEAEGVDGRGDQEPVSPSELLAQAGDARVDAQGDKDEGDCDEDPFGYLGVESVSHSATTHGLACLGRGRNTPCSPFRRF